VVNCHNPGLKERLGRAQHPKRIDHVVSPFGFGFREDYTTGKNIPLSSLLYNLRTAL